MVFLLVENLEERELSSAVKSLILEWAGKGTKQAKFAELVGKTQQCISYNLTSHASGAGINKSTTRDRKNATASEDEGLIKRLSLEKRFVVSDKLRNMV